MRVLFEIEGTYVLLWGCNIDINRFESDALLPGKFAYWKTSYGIDYKIEPVYCSIELILVFIDLINLME